VNCEPDSGLLKQCKGKRGKAMKKTIPFLIAAAISTLFIACEALPEGPDSIWNPLDPANPNYAAPEPDDVSGRRMARPLAATARLLIGPGRPA
jgi:hypothetical protein